MGEEIAPDISKDIGLPPVLHQKGKGINQQKCEMRLLVKIHPPLGEPSVPNAPKFPRILPAIDTALANNPLPCYIE